eukprot:1328048-Rhodomonas_salina.2
MVLKVKQSQGNCSLKQLLLQLLAATTVSIQFGRFCSRQEFLLATLRCDKDWIAVLSLSLLEGHRRSCYGESYSCPGDGEGRNSYLSSFLVCESVTRREQNPLGTPGTLGRRIGTPRNS